MSKDNMNDAVMTDEQLGIIDNESTEIASLHQLADELIAQQNTANEEVGALQSKLAEISQSLSELQSLSDSQQRESQQQIQKLKEEHKTVSAQLAERQKDFEQLVEKNTELKQKIAEVEAQQEAKRVEFEGRLKILEEEKGSAISFAFQKQSALDSLEAEKSALSEEKIQVEEQLQSAEQLLKTTKNNLKELTEEYVAKLSNLAAENVGLKDTLNSREDKSADNEKFMDENRSLRRQLGVVQQEQKRSKESYDAQLAKKTSEIEALKDLGQKLNEKQAEIDRLNAEIITLKSEVEEKDVTINQLVEGIARAKNAERESLELRERAEGLQKAAEEEVGRLTDVVRNFEAKITDLTTANQNLENKNSNLQRSLGTSQNNLEQAQSDLARATTELERITKLNTELRDKLTEAEGSAREAIALVKTQQNLLQEKETEIHSIDAKLSKLEQEKGKLEQEVRKAEKKFTQFKSFMAKNMADKELSLNKAEKAQAMAEGRADRLSAIRERVGLGENNPIKKRRKDKAGLGGVGVKSIIELESQSDLSGTFQNHAYMQPGYDLDLARMADSFRIKDWSIEDLLTEQKKNDEIIEALRQEVGNAYFGYNLDSNGRLLEEKILRFIDDTSVLDQQDKVEKAELLERLEEAQEAQNIINERLEVELLRQQALLKDIALENQERMPDAVNVEVLEEYEDRLIELQDLEHNAQQQKFGIISYIAQYQSEIKAYEASIKEIDRLSAAIAKDTAELNRLNGLEGESDKTTKLQEKININQQALAAFQNEHGNQEEIINTINDLQERVSQNESELTEHQRDIDDYQPEIERLTNLIAETLRINRLHDSAVAEAQEVAIVGGEIGRKLDEVEAQLRAVQNKWSADIKKKQQDLQDVNNRINALNTESLLGQGRNADNPRMSLTDLPVLQAALEFCDRYSLEAFQEFVKDQGLTTTLEDLQSKTGDEKTTEVEDKIVEIEEFIAIGTSEQRDQISNIVIGTDVTITALVGEVERHKNLESLTIREENLKAEISDIEKEEKARSYRRNNLQAIINIEDRLKAAKASATSTPEDITELSVAKRAYGLKLAVEIDKHNKVSVPARPTITKVSYRPAGGKKDSTFHAHRLVGLTDRGLVGGKMELVDPIVPKNVIDAFLKSQFAKDEVKLRELSDTLLKIAADLPCNKEDPTKPFIIPSGLDISKYIETYPNSILAALNTVQDISVLQGGGPGLRRVDNNGTKSQSKSAKNINIRFAYYADKAGNFKLDAHLQECMMDGSPQYKIVAQIATDESNGVRTYKKGDILFKIVDMKGNELIDIAGRNTGHLRNEEFAGLERRLAEYKVKVAVEHYSKDGKLQSSKQAEISDYTQAQGFKYPDQSAFGLEVVGKIVGKPFIGEYQDRNFYHIKDDKIIFKDWLDDTQLKIAVEQLMNGHEINKIKYKNIDLDLSGCSKLTGKGLGCLSRLSKLQSGQNPIIINNINLYKCKAVDDISVLADFSNLRSVDLRGTAINTSEQLKPLLKLPKLSDLSIDSTMKSGRKKQLTEFLKEANKKSREVGQLNIHGDKFVLTRARESISDGTKALVQGMYETLPDPLLRVELPNLVNSKGVFRKEAKFSFIKDTIEHGGGKQQSYDISKCDGLTAKQIFEIKEIADKNFAKVRFFTKKDLSKLRNPIILLLDLEISDCKREDDNSKLKTFIERLDGDYPDLADKRDALKARTDRFEAEIYQSEDNHSNQLQRRILLEVFKADIAELVVGKRTLVNIRVGHDVSGRDDQECKDQIKSIFCNTLNPNNPAVADLAKDGSIMLDFRDRHFIEIDSGYLNDLGKNQAKIGGFNFAGNKNPSQFDEVFFNHLKQNLPELTHLDFTGCSFANKAQKNTFQKDLQKFKSENPKCSVVGLEGQELPPSVVKPTDCGSLDGFRSISRGG